MLKGPRTRRPSAKAKIANNGDPSKSLGSDHPLQTDQAARSAIKSVSSQTSSCFAARSSLPSCSQTIAQADPAVTATVNHSVSAPATHHYGTRSRLSSCSRTSKPDPLVSADVVHSVSAVAASRSVTQSRRPSCSRITKAPSAVTANVSQPVSSLATGRRNAQPRQSTCSRITALADADSSSNLCQSVLLSATIPRAKRSNLPRRSGISGQAGQAPQALIPDLNRRVSASATSSVANQSIIPRCSQTTAQADTTVTADLKQPVGDVTANSHVTWSGLPARTTTQAASGSKSHAANASLGGLSLIAQQSTRVSTEHSNPTVIVDIEQPAADVTSSSHVTQSSVPTRTTTQVALANRSHAAKSSSGGPSLIAQQITRVSAEPGNPAITPDLKKPVADVTTTCHVTRSSLTARTATKAALGSQSHAATARLGGLSLIAQQATGASTGAGMSKSLAIPKSTIAVPDLRAQVLLAGKQHADSTIKNAQPHVSVHTSPSKRSHAGTSTKLNEVPINKDNHKKSKISPEAQGQAITDHIKSEVSFDGSPPPLETLGERCQLCQIDLAFRPMSSESSSDNPPPAAVLPCGHCFHEICLEDVFGPVEPSCLFCSNGS